jgi:hypothetical protein
MSPKNNTARIVGAIAGGKEVPSNELSRPNLAPRPGRGQTAAAAKQPPAPTAWALQSALDFARATGRRTGFALFVVSEDSREVIKIEFDL